MAVFQRFGVHPFPALCADDPRGRAPCSGCMRVTLASAFAGQRLVEVGWPQAPLAARAVLLAGSPPSSGAACHIRFIGRGRGLAHRLSLAGRSGRRGDVCGRLALRGLGHSGHERGVRRRLALFESQPLVRPPCSALCRLDPPGALPSFRQPRVPWRGAISRRETAPRKSLLTFRVSTRAPAR
jgi:hypothetical protein